ncbi:MAG: PhoH family protein [Oscillospiraceae bacterium]|nr:PhoH family protein [Oscillospiraceae bacterium]
MEERVVNLKNSETAAIVFGNFDKNLSLLERTFKVSIIGRDANVMIEGDSEKIDSAEKALMVMQKFAITNGYLDDQMVNYSIGLAENGEASKAVELDGAAILITPRGKPIKPKTLGQKDYVNAIASNFIVFGVGPAGTGKTYLSVAMAVKYLKSHEVNRIILTRPAVEAGEKLGFLPGDLQTKVDPYLRPLYDALFDTLGIEQYQRCMERGMIEVAPLAYMRGRTLDNAFIILDEAQNTTPEQMKMFLTRLGTGSKMVINGDTTQIDLPDKHKSGLLDAIRVLGNINGISFIKLTERDIVRFRLVSDIVKAYERAASQFGGQNGK